MARQDYQPFNDTKWLNAHRRILLRPKMEIKYPYRAVNVQSVQQGEFLIGHSDLYRKIKERKAHTLLH